MKNKKLNRTLSKSIISTLLISIVSSSVVFAKTDAILTKDPTTEQYFQYDLTALSSDAVNKVLGLASPLYDEYNGKTLQAFHDDKNGYIAKDAVNNEAVNAVINGTTFSLDTYTASAPSSAVITPTSSIQTRVLTANGSVVNGIVIDTSQTVLAKVESVIPAPAPGSTIVLVSLPVGVDATKYTVTVGGTILTYYAASGKFAGIVANSYATTAAAQTDLVLVLKSTQTITATVASVTKAPTPESTIVIVILPTGVDATKYTVTVGGTAIPYNATAQKFAGIVPKTYATVADAQAVTVLTSKDTTN